MKNFYPFQVIDLRLQVDHFTPRKIQIFQEFSEDPDNERLFIILIRHRQIEVISDGNKIIEVKVIQMKILNFRDFMKKYNLKHDTMNKSQLQKSNNYPIYPGDSKIYSDKGFVYIDSGSRGGTHWTCFRVKDNKSCYFDSFGGALDIFLLNQLPKPRTYRNCKTQNMISKLCGSYCLYFFYLIERMKHFETFLKLVFE